MIYTPIKDGNISSLVNRYTWGLLPYVQGKSLKEAQERSGIPINNIAKLASNENPLGPSPKVLEALKYNLSSIHRYPESQNAFLRESLAERAGLDRENVLLGNGSNELIELVARTFLTPETEVIYGNPAFIVYSMASQAVGAQKKPVPLKNFTHDLSEIKKAVTSKTRVIFIDNPNNPTGTLVPRKEMETFLGEISPEIIVVLDEAYYEYLSRDNFVNAAYWINSDKKVIFLRTFSKFFALAGLRIGYALCSTDIVQWINRVRDPFNVNSLAVMAAAAALEDGEHGEAVLESIRMGKKILEEGYMSLGLDFVPTKTNFYMVDTQRDATAASNVLFEKGVIVRSLPGYNLPTHLRISIGSEKENKYLLKILREVLPLIKKLKS